MVANGATRVFSALAKDQFGHALVVTPSFTWSAVGTGGSIDGSGLFTATNNTGVVTVQAQATSGVTRTGSATVTLTDVNAAPASDDDDGCGPGLGLAFLLGMMAFAAFPRRNHSARFMGKRRQPQDPL
jgi:hypothetical protein